MQLTIDNDICRGVPALVGTSLLAVPATALLFWGVLALESKEFLEGGAADLRSELLPCLTPWPCFLSY